MCALSHPQLPLPGGFKCHTMVSGGLKLKSVRGGNGPLLVFVHGLGGSVEDYYPLMERLAPDFECLAWDWPGFGYSEKPDIDYGIGLFGDVLGDILGQLPQKPMAVAGHSMGGHVALKYAIDHPGFLDNIVALCPAGGHIDAKWYHRLLFAFWVKKDDRLRHVRPLIMKHIAMWPFADRNTELCHRFGDKFTDQWYDGDTKYREIALVRSGRSILETPIWSDVQGIDANVLMITGARDHITPADDTNRLAAGIPHVRQAVTNQGHMSLLTDTESVAQQMRLFLL